MKGELVGRTRGQMKNRDQRRVWNPVEHLVHSPVPSCYHQPVNIATDDTGSLCAVTRLACEKGFHVVAKGLQNSNKLVNPIQSLTSAGHRISDYEDVHDQTFSLGAGYSAEVVSALVFAVARLSRQASQSIVLPLLSNEAVIQAPRRNRFTSIAHIRTIELAIAHHTPVAPEWST